MFFQSQKVFVFHILETLYIFSYNFFENIWGEDVFFTFSKTHWNHAQILVKRLCKWERFFWGGHLSGLEDKFSRAAQTVSKVPILPLIL